jgi:hypothetical protein
MEKTYTIVYKTYQKDLRWLKYSLLSLKKFLTIDNVHEIIFFVHDIALLNLTQLLEELDMINFVNYRIIAIHYDYHGYLKQMVVKSNSFSECKTDYIVILDSDLILKRNMNFNVLVRDDGKIEWQYLKKESDPKHGGFNVWRNAVETTTKSKQEFHYMSRGVPFIFTKRSMEMACNKFIELHGKTYDEYCKEKCLDSKIPIVEGVGQHFNPISKIFTEYEFIGNCCHKYSEDYVFIPTDECIMLTQKKLDTDNYFIVFWSHGGISTENKKFMDDLLT